MSKRGILLSVFLLCQFYHVQGGLDGRSEGDDSTTEVIELTDDNFDERILKSYEPWLVEFYVPDCDQCKELTPHFAAAAQKLKGRMNFGTVDATVYTLKASEYRVKEYPTIKYFPGGKKTGSKEYDGGRDSNLILLWAYKKLGSTIPSPQITQIVNDEILTGRCRKYLICIVSVLPHILDCDSKCRNGYLEMLQELGEKFKKQGWGWVWTQAGDYLNLEKSIDIGALGYPTMAAVNVKKGMFALFRGSFSEANIVEFLSDFTKKGRSASPIIGGELPKLSSVEPWDGKDGQLPSEEEFEFGEKHDYHDNEKDELWRIVLDSILSKINFIL